MTNKRLIIQALKEYHLTEVVAFYKDWYAKSDVDDKIYFLETIYNTPLSDTIDTVFFQNIINTELDNIVRVLAIKNLYSKDKALFKKIFLYNFNVLEWDERAIKIILPVLDDKEYVLNLRSFLATKDIILKANIIESMVRFPVDEVIQIIREVMKSGNDLLQLSAIKGFDNEKFFEFLYSKVFSGNSTIEIACISKFGKLLSSDNVNIKIKKTILSIINEKLDSEEEIVRIASIKCVSFFEKKIFRKLTELWEKLHPIYFPVLKDALMNNIIMDKDNNAEKLLFEELNIFKIKNFMNFLYKINHKELMLFLFQNFRKKDDFEVFSSRIVDFLLQNKIFIDQRFILSFFRDLDEAQIMYFRSNLEKVFMREFVPFRFREIDIKIISEYLDIAGILSLDYSRHFNYINYDYIKIAILKFIEKTDENFSFLVECAKYKSDAVKEAAIFSLGEFINATNFLIGLYKNASEAQKINIIKAVSLKKSENRKTFLLKEFFLDNISDDLKNELMEALNSYYDDNIIVELSEKIFLEESSLKLRLKALRILINSKNEVIKYIQSLIDPGIITNKKDFLNLCDSIKFIDKEKAVDIYIIMLDKFPQFGNEIIKFLYFYRNSETASKLINLM
ncbi:MAG: hypothetical protein M0R46_05290 [Candidatus Muirbacterium halophilum]|nr:hypothetical protein [Candidatus Muirbacterium halophilum]MCK9475309.1 hypothetical protein [Candidatus Muirbacterium halophilum]